MRTSLVTYFSASGVNKSAAEKLASMIGADLFEIVLERLYTKADLNWMNKKSRSFLKMSDRSYCLAIAAKIESISRYTHNTLGISKYPFCQMTAEKPEATYAYVYFGEAVCPEDIREQSICIDGDIGQVIEELRKTE